MKKPNLKKWDSVHVKWQDIVGEGPHWDECNDDLKPASCETLGFVLYKNKQYLTICGSKTDNVVSDKTVIPWGCIVEVIKLEPVQGKLLNTCTTQSRG